MMWLTPCSSNTATFRRVIAMKSRCGTTNRRPSESLMANGLNPLDRRSLMSSVITEAAYSQCIVRQSEKLVVAGPVALDGALQVSFTNGFVAGSGDFFNVLSYASRSGQFASSSAVALGLTESYTPTSLLLIAGTNAYPSLAFTVAGGNTQTVCVPFGLQASATDVDGVVTNLRDVNLRRLVWERAGSCCEYCRMKQEFDELTFQIAKAGKLVPGKMS
jgi:hypothetical protein